MFRCFNIVDSGDSGRKARRRQRTNIGAKIHGLEDLDAQVWLNFADDLDGVIER